MAARQSSEHLRSAALAAALWAGLTAAGAQPAASVNEPARRVIELAQSRWEDAWSSANARVADCLQQARRQANHRLLDAAALTARQKEVTAFVLAARAQARCEQDARGAAALALAQYRAVLRHHGREPTESDAERETTLVDPGRSLLEREALEYASIDAQQRARLEALAEFKTPFDFIATMESLRAGTGR
jgi:hypothetical protein